MEWTQLKVSCEKEDLDTVCAVMCMLDNGLMIEDTSDLLENVRPEFSEVVDEQLLDGDGECSVSIFVPEEKEPAGYLEFIKTRLGEAGVIYTCTTVGCSEEQWADNWKKYYKTVKLGRSLVIVPQWEKYEPKEGEVCVRMDPGMAFGTGTHESTRLCARLLEEYIRPGDLVLDLGTGSGILGIAASKFGARHVDCCDIDPVAVKVARENARDNKTDNVECFVSDLLAQVERHGEYDLVCANIIADILLRLAPDLADYMKSGACVICSGIISSQYEQVCDAFLSYGFRAEKRLSENDWNAAVFIKK